MKASHHQLDQGKKAKPTVAKGSWEAPSMDPRSWWRHSEEISWWLVRLMLIKWQNPVVWKVLIVRVVDLAEVAEAPSPNKRWRAHDFHVGGARETKAHPLHLYNNSSEAHTHSPQIKSLPGSTSGSWSVQSIASCCAMVVKRPRSPDFRGFRGSIES